MKSIPTHAGNLKMRGRLTMKMSCGCCVAENFKHQVYEPISYLLEDDYPYEEFMADICTDEDPCEMCRARQVVAKAAA